MGLPKGTTNNPNGRPKGSKNKVTKEVQATLAEVLENEAAELPELLKSMEPRHRVEAITKLLAYVIPKNVKTETEVSQFEHVTLTAEEAREISKALEEEY